jgi:hypothetical protein
MFALIVPLGGGDGFPDNSLPPGYGHPDQGLPDGGPDHIWWGGRRPPRPDQGLPEGGGHPSHRPLPPGTPTPHAAVAESSIPSHPPKPDPNKPGEWLLVAMGDGSVGWAWAETAPPPPQPK